MIDTKTLAKEFAPSNWQVKNKNTIDKIHIKLKINEIYFKNLSHSFFSKHLFCNFSKLKIVIRLLRKYGYPGALLIVGVTSVSRLGFCNEKTPLLIILKEMSKYPSAGTFNSCTILVQKKNNETPKIIKIKRVIKFLFLFSRYFIFF